MNPRKFPRRRFTYIEINCLDIGAKRIARTTELFGQDAPTRARQLVSAGDVLVSTTRPNLNAVALVPPDLEGALCSTGFCVLRPDHALDAGYLFQWVQIPEFVRGLSLAVSGSIYPAVTDKQVRAQVLPLAPIHEQRRLARVMDQTSTCAAAASFAITGGATAASALLAAYLDRTFQELEAQDWPETRLGQVLQLRQEIIHPRNNPVGLAQFVGLEHIEPEVGRRGGSLWVDKSKLSGRKAQFHKGDIVYGYLRPYLNKVWVAEFDGLCSVDQYVFRPVSEKVWPNYVAWFMRSPIYLERAPVSTTPGQLPRIRTDEVAGVPLRLPPLDIQKEASARIERFAHNSLSLKHALSSSFDAVTALRESICRKAFSGQL